MLCVYQLINNNNIIYNNDHGLVSNVFSVGVSFCSYEIQLLCFACCERLEYVEKKFNWITESIYRPEGADALRRV